MGMFINAQEDIIAREATRQILALNPAIAAKLQPKEVIAYTLNRVHPAMPPLNRACYASGSQP